jgi:AcrR family transcriptional regulator
VIAAVADAGYTAVTVADIVQGARVSRSVFYAHFADKEDCFLSATREGGRLMSGRMASATRVVPPDACDEQVLRAGFPAFLEFLADEQAFARALYVDLPTAGPIAAERLAEASHRFANLNRKWHGRARTGRAPATRNGRLSPLDRVAPGPPRPTPRLDRRARCVPIGR